MMDAGRPLDLPVGQRHARHVEAEHYRKGRRRRADGVHRVVTAIDRLDGIEAVGVEEAAYSLRSVLPSRRRLRAVGIDQSESYEVMTPMQCVATTTAKSATGTTTRIIGPVGIARPSAPCQARAAR